MLQIERDYLNMLVHFEFEEALLKDFEVVHEFPF